MSVLQVVLQQLGGPDRGMISRSRDAVKVAAIQGSMTSAIEGGRPGRGVEQA